MLKFLLTFCSCFVLLSAFSQIKDVDGNSYEMVALGNLEWSGSDLRVLHFNNGDEIPLVKNCKDWFEAGKNKKPACAYYQYDEKNALYGLYYNWYAITDSRGLVPKGAEIPNEKDYENLIGALGGEDKAGTMLKSTSGWTKENGDNESELNMLPYGALQNINGKEECVFDKLGHYTYYWTSTPVNADFSDQPDLVSYGYTFRINGYDGGVGTYSNPYNHSGHFVRFIKK